MSGGDEASAAEFLRKPFRDQALLDVIHHANQRDRANQKSLAAIPEMRARYETLTPRECKVLAVVVTDLLNANCS
jgi:FixJ family two-component response regulator